MPRLLLLAYGRETEYRRALLAVLSCWAWQPQLGLAATICTDQPDFFRPFLAGLDIDYKLATPEYLTQARGPQQFVHRVKAQFIAEAFAEHPAEELLFIDSDTFFIASPDSLLQNLAAGQAFMHLREYTLAEAVGIYTEFNQAKYPKKLLELLASRTFGLGGRQVQFHAGQSSWNSGVLGLPRALAPLLPDILTLTDKLYADTGWFTCEQLAFSLALQASGPVHASDGYLYHYWEKPQKKLMDNLLPAFFTSTLAALPLASRLLRVRQQLAWFQRQMELGKAQEGALYALRRGRLVAGLKCVAKALLAKPLDARFMREVLRVLRVLHRQSRLRHARQWARL
ncbi:MAG: hypothetical protein ACRYF0_02325 [Janthinobacterium lividum]